MSKDRNAILARRAKLIAAALAGIASATTQACGSEVTEGDSAQESTGSSMGGAQVCLTVGEGGWSDGGAGGDSGAGGGSASGGSGTGGAGTGGAGDGGKPIPCLAPPPSN
jgi:hypothetical protein